jgi:hypothetical protein
MQIRLIVIWLTKVQLVDQCLVNEFSLREGVMSI